MFNGTNLIPNFEVDWDIERFVFIKDPYLIDASSPSTNNSIYKNDIKQK